MCINMTTVFYSSLSVIHFSSSLLGLGLVMPSSYSPLGLGLLLLEVSERNKVDLKKNIKDKELYFRPRIGLYLGLEFDLIRQIKVWSDTVKLK